MKNTNNNLELKIYEKLGVKKFRNIIVKILYYIAILPSIFTKKSKEELEKNFYNTPSNYFMKKGNGISDLKDFKKFLYINSAIHILALIPCITGLLAGGFIIDIPLIIFNLYCIMLQRYNYIRIDSVIKKHENEENKQKEKLKEIIKENTDEQKIIHYTSFKGLSTQYVDKKIDLDEFLNLISLNDLKRLKNNLIKLQNIEYPTLRNKVYTEKDCYKVYAKIKKKN